MRDRRDRARRNCARLPAHTNIRVAVDFSLVLLPAGRGRLPPRSRGHRHRTDHAVRRGIRRLDSDAFRAQRRMAGIRSRPVLHIAVVKQGGARQGARDALLYEPRWLEGPAIWPDGRAGPWRARTLTLDEDYVGWVCCGTSRCPHAWSSTRDKARARRARVSRRPRRPSDALDRRRLTPASCRITSTRPGAVRWYEQRRSHVAGSRRSCLRALGFAEGDTNRC